jgi:hypothetical protein
MAWKERKGSLHLFLCLIGSDGFVDDVTRKIGGRRSGPAGASRLRIKTVPFTSTFLHPPTFLNYAVLISLRIIHSSLALPFQNICSS